MSSKLVAAQNDIAALWVALIPSADAGVRFRRVKHVEHLSHRSFYFSTSDSFPDSEFGGSFAVKRYTLTAVIRIDFTGKDLTTAPELLANDRVLLENTVVFNPAWSAGVRAVHFRGSKTEPTGDDAVDIRMSLEIICEESDGT